MRRICLVIVTVLLGSCGIFAQAPQSITKVNRLCGYLQNETRTSRVSVPKAEITLYRRESGVDCCNVQDLLAEIQTNSDGRFELKHIPAGAYWVVAVGESRKYRMAIDFAPVKDAQECGENLYTIEINGNFVLKTYVTVS